MKRIPTASIAIGLCLLTAGAITVASAESVPPVIRIATMHGDVTFHHANHQIWSKGECELCHHQGAGILKCGKCHNGSSAKIEREVIHDMCRGCHEKNTTALTPKECGDCHGS